MNIAWQCNGTSDVAGVDLSSAVSVMCESREAPQCFHLLSLIKRQTASWSPRPAYISTWLTKFNQILVVRIWFFSSYGTDDIIHSDIQRKGPSTYDVHKIFRFVEPVHQWLNPTSPLSPFDHWILQQNSLNLPYFIFFWRTTSPHPLDHRIFPITH